MHYLCFHCQISRITCPPQWLSRENAKTLSQLVVTARFQPTRRSLFPPDWDDLRQVAAAALWPDDVSERGWPCTAMWARYTLKFYQLPGISSIGRQLPGPAQQAMFSAGFDLANPSILKVWIKIKKYTNGAAGAPKTVNGLKIFFSRHQSDYNFCLTMIAFFQNLLVMEL